MQTARSDVCEMLAATVLIFNFLIPVKLIGIKSLSSLEHVINSASEFLCNDAHGFCFSIPLHKFIMPPLATFIIAEKENCPFRECPLQMDVSDFIIAVSAWLRPRLAQNAPLEHFAGLRRRSLPFSFLPADSWEHFTRRQ